MDLPAMQLIGVRFLTGGDRVWNERRQMYHIVEYVMRYSGEHLVAYTNGHTDHHRCNQVVYVASNRQHADEWMQRRKEVPG